MSFRSLITFCLTILAASGFLSPEIRAQTIPDGAVSLWPGEGNATDSQGTNSGALMNGAGFGQGKTGQAFLLDGVNDFVQIGPSPSLVMTNGLSISAWIHPTGSAPVQMIVSREGEYLLARFSDGTIRWAFANTKPGWDWINTGFAAVPNQWTHITVVYSSGTIRTYANGALIHVYSGTGSIGDAWPAANDFRIGGRQLADQYFAGMLDEIAIWNRSLTESEVQSLFFQGYVLIESRWTGDDTTNDSVGTNHGTMMNGASFATGKIGQSFSLDGIDDYVQIGPSSSLVMTNGLSISAWIFPTGSAPIQVIGGKEGEYLLARFSDGTIRMAMANTYPGWDWINTGYVAGQNRWTHIAVTYDTDTVRAYANGTLVHAAGAAGWIGDTWQAANDFRIGGRQLADQYFGGMIDELGIWNRVLSAPEVQTLFSQGQTPLESHWSGENNAADVQNIHPGTLMNETGFAQGRVGRAFLLDGVDDYIQVGASGDLVMTSSLSISAWIFPTGSAPVQMIVSREGEYLLARFSDGTIRLAFANSYPGWDWINTGYVARQNQWTHLAVLYNVGTVKTYADGVLVHTFYGSGWIGDAWPAANDFRIGGRQLADQYFAGMIDEVRVWNRVLSTDEIDAAYRVTGTAPLVVPIPDTQTPDTSLTRGVDGFGAILSNNAWTSSTSITFAFTGTDNIRVASFETSLDGAAFSTASSPVAYTGLAEGSHTVQVRARDMAGNVDPSPETFSWTIDRTAPPAPDLLSPADASATGDPRPRCDWTGVSDPSGVRYAIQIDNAADLSSPEITQNGLSTASFVPPESLADGTWYWRVRATDGVGNTGSFSAPRSFVIDTTPPLPGEVFDGSAAGMDIRFQSSTTIMAVNWNGFTDRETGIIRYAWAIGTTPSGTEVQSYVDVGTNTTASHTALTLTHGTTYYVSVRAMNGAGLTTSVSSNGVIVDTVGPTVSGVRVSASPVDRNTPLTLTAGALDDYGTVSDAEYFIDADPGIGRGFALSAGDGSWDSKAETLTAVIPETIIASLTEGNHTCIVRAKDEVGNWGAVGSAVLIVNNAPLTVTPLGFSPAELNTTYGPSVSNTELQFELSEPAVITLRIYDRASDALVKTLLSGASVHPGTQSYRWSGDDNAGVYLTSGEFYYQITGTDGLGNAIAPAADSRNSASNAPTARISTSKPAIADLTTNSLSFSPARGQTLTIRYTLYNNDTQYPDLQVTVEILNDLQSIVRSYTAAVSGVTAGGVQSSTEWDGKDIQGTVVPNGNYLIRISAAKVRPGATESAESRTESTVVTVVSTRYMESKDGVLAIFYSPDHEEVTINESPLVPVPALLSLYDLHRYGSHVLTPIYELRQQLGLTLTGSLIFRYSQTLSDEELQIVRYDPVLERWESVTPVIHDPTHKRILVAVSGFSSLYTLISNKDVMPPRIGELLFTPSIQTFTVSDAQSGVNVGATKILFDGQDVTNHAAFSALNGSSQTTVHLALPYDPGVRHTLRITAKDMAGNPSIREETFSGGFADIRVRITPRVLKTNPGVLTAHIRLPDGFDTAAITSAFCDGAPARDMAQGDSDDDHGRDEDERHYRSRSVLKFQRTDIETALARAGQSLDTTFLITGTILDRNGNTVSFAGMDTIHAVKSRKHHDPHGHDDD